ncbi:MAG: pyridoxal 5'-phosphate synthase glutaminase subunit PdxT [Dehalococcoidales bacterium]|nr:pyridoxal 5'-phosphate synthase glutaminase subunit PdxT [Dehalococcoidales bacterium]MDD4465836.1 pyridoxal 5'-phosphate synthase glutaminase subunit PdxT [Dehalococcoidales bacterium]
MKVGVLSLQGTFIEHVNAIRKLGVDALEVRKPENLHGISGVIIPGGESTVITRLMHYYRLVEPLKRLAENSVPFLGTCAGMICLSKDVGSPVELETLELLDIRVNRNAFGRQVASFETELNIPVLGEKPFPGLFIRGPVVEHTGDGVEVIARIDDGRIVAVQQGNILATAFHPELMEDLRLHQYFLQLVLKTVPEARLL